MREMPACHPPAWGPQRGYLTLRLRAADSVGYSVEQLGDIRGRSE